MAEGKRYYLLDSLRGLSVLSMVLYHFAFDLAYIARLDGLSLTTLSAFIWQQSICLSFILISGFCFFVAKHPLKNGLIVFLSGGAVTLVTALLMPSAAIYFGILTLLGSAMLLLLPIRQKLYKIPQVAGAAVSLLLFIFFYSASGGTLLFGLFELPDFLYANVLTAFIGFPPKSFSSGDYFPLLPWIFLYLTGFFLCGSLKKYGEPKFLFFKVPILEWIGRKALIIYLAHQPILYGITLLTTKVI